MDSDRGRAYFRIYITANPVCSVVFDRREAICPYANDGLGCAVLILTL